MPALESLAGGAGPPTTHLSRVRTKRPALSRLKPLGPPHTPQCPRSLLVLDGPPIGLLLVHLKGLWARAARSLKGAARSRVSLWTPPARVGTLVAAGGKSALQKEGRKISLEIVKLSAVRETRGSGDVVEVTANEARTLDSDLGPVLRGCLMQDSHLRVS
ncbi:LRP4-AS1 isoform 3 [Pongo abelii]|uniref:LRP4-AS1 isoform 3 n=1 Tax=Pongo abelii TaxID=9601 RepID=A0A2J8WF69_PONAB|nr:LRP4-AS1 isoform 3 [Pongo abelii]